MCCWSPTFPIFFGIFPTFLKLFKRISSSFMGCCDFELLFLSYCFSYLFSIFLIFSTVFLFFLPETYLILVSLENRIFNSYLSRTCFVFYSYLSYLRHGPAFPLLERFSPKPLYPFKKRGVAMQDVACVHMSKVMKGFQSPVI